MSRKLLYLIYALAGFIALSARAADAPLCREWDSGEYAKSNGYVVAELTEAQREDFMRQLVAHTGHREVHPDQVYILAKGSELIAMLLQDGCILGLVNIQLPRN